MIIDDEVGRILLKELPELEKGSISDSEKVSVYQNIKVLADYTCRLIDQHNYLVAGKCFNLAERLFLEGSTTTQNAIDNIFIYCVTTRSQALSGLKTLMPFHVRKEYHRQIYCSGL